MLGLFALSSTLAWATPECPARLDNRYRREVVEEPRAAPANRAAKLLLNEAIAPLMTELHDRVLALDAAAIRARMSRVERAQPLIGPLPVRLIEDLVRLRETTSDFTAYLYWLTHAEHVRVGEMDEVLRADSRLSEHLDALIARLEAIEDDFQNAVGPRPREDSAELRARMYRSLTGHRVVTPERDREFQRRTTPALNHLRRNVSAADRAELRDVLSNLVENVVRAREDAAPDVFDRTARVFYVAHRDRAEVVPTDASFAAARGALTTVGAGGDAFAIARLRTTNILTRFISETMTDSAREAYRAAPQMWAAEAARVKTLLQTTASDLGVVSVLQEGVISLNQLITLVMSDLIPGEDVDRTLADLLLNERELVTDLTYRHPMGVIGPAAIAGRAYADALSRRREILAPSASLVRRGRALRHAAQAKDRAEPRCPGRTGRGCPAGPGGGIEALARAYLHVFRLVRAGGARMPN